MSDRKLTPYSGQLSNKSRKDLHDARTVSVEVMPPVSKQIATITNTLDNSPKTIPIKILTSAGLFLNVIKTGGFLDVKETKEAFEASERFKNIIGTARINYNTLQGLFGEEGIISQLTLAFSPSFSNNDIIEINKLKTLNESDKFRLNDFVRAILTKGENFTGDNAKRFRKDPEMKAILSQITNRVENGEHKNIEKQESVSIKVNEFVYDFDIDTYNIELLRAMKFILERFISKPNTTENNSKQELLK